MVVIETLKSKISDFLNSNTCFWLQLYGSTITILNDNIVRPTAGEMITPFYKN